MERPAAVALFDRLHEARNKFYGGGGDVPFRGLLAADVTGRCRVTTASPASTGAPTKVCPLPPRRDLSGATLRMHRKDILVGEFDTICSP